MSTNQYPTLASAPIREAVIHFRTRKTDIKAEQVEGQISSAFGENFDEIQPIHKHSFEFKVGPGEDSMPGSSAHHAGFRATSSDSSQIVQLLDDQFIYSQLAPYDKWETFIGRAKDLWQSYCKIFECPGVIRVATRFINDLNLPIQMSNFEDYLTASPKIPDSLPQAMSSFLSRVVIEVPEVPATVIFTQSFEPVPPDADGLPVIIDIDVFQRGQYSADSDEIWTLLTEMRQVKNDTFFGALTDKTLEAYR